MIRIAKKKDLEKLIEFLNDPIIDKQFVTPLSQRDISIKERVYSKYKQGVWLIALDGDKICGCRALIYNPSENTITLSTFVVHPDYRGQGLGRSIYQKSIDVAVEKYNPSSIFVDSWSTNKMASILAKKFGFKKIKEYEEPDKRPEGIKTVLYELKLHE